MDNGQSSVADLRQFIADYMEKGFLENIIDMFLHSSSLYALVGDLIRDERIRVRIGTTALMEELAVRDKAHIAHALPSLMPLLDHPEPVVRGDAVNLLGIAGDKSVLPLLEKALLDENPDVRYLAHEAIETIRNVTI